MGIEGKKHDESQIEKISDSNETNNAQLKDDFSRMLIELRDKKLSPDEEKVIEKRRVDIYKDKDVVTHVTKPQYLLDILRFGLGSIEYRRKLARRGHLNVADQYNQGTHSYSFGHFGKHEISMTLNKEWLREDEQLPKDLQKKRERILYGTNDIALIYFLSEIERKFVAKKTTGERIQWRGTTNEGWLVGSWKGEILALRRIEPDFIRGIVVSKKVSSIPLSEYFDLLRSEYGMSPETEKLKEELGKAQEILGDVPLSELLKLISEELLVPIYSESYAEKA